MHEKAEAEAAKLKDLSEVDRKMVEELLAEYPSLTAEKALAMLNEAGM